MGAAYLALFAEAQSDDQGIAQLEAAGQVSKKLRAAPEQLRGRQLQLLQFRGQRHVVHPGPCAKLSAVIWRQERCRQVQGLLTALSTATDHGNGV